MHTLPLRSGITSTHTHTPIKCFSLKYEILYFLLPLGSSEVTRYWLEPSPDFCVRFLISDVSMGPS